MITEEHAHRVRQTLNSLDCGDITLPDYQVALMEQVLEQYRDEAPQRLRQMMRDDPDYHLHRRERLDRLVVEMREKLKRWEEMEQKFGRTLQENYAHHR